MDLNPQDENAIVLMVLRDIREILERQPNFSFNFSYEVKLQKVFFLLADSLEIPITRSWYRYGPYIHNENVSAGMLANLQDNIDIDDIHSILRAEELFSEINNEYKKKLNELVLNVFFQPLQKLLTDIYKEHAPEEYKKIYLANLVLQRSFRNANNYAAANRKTLRADFFLENLSNLSANVLTRDDTAIIYDYTERYAELLQDCLERMNSNNHLSLRHIILLKNTYESTIWFPLALRISINTMTGLNREKEKRVQSEKLQSMECKIDNHLEYLEEKLENDGLLRTADERTHFFNAKYGSDKEFINAVSKVWTSYK